MIRRLHQGGFTLLEVLIAFTLLALMMALIYAGLSTGARSSAKGEKFIEETERIRITQQFVRRQLASALPLIMRSDEEENVIDEQPEMFVGEERYMRFVAHMPGYLGFGGPHIQEFELVSGRDGLELMFNHRLLGSEEADDDSEPILLLSGIASGAFAYRSIDGAGEVGDWEPEWEEVGTIPKLVVIDLKLDDSTRHTWPQLTISPAIDTGASNASQTRSNLLPGGIRSPTNPAMTSRNDDSRR